MKVVCDRQVGRRELMTAWLDEGVQYFSHCYCALALTALQKLACLDRMAGRTYKQTYGRTDGRRDGQTFVVKQL